MGELVRNLRIHREELEPDTISDFAFAFGDMNSRTSLSFDEVMEKFEYVKENKKELDQLLKSRLSHGKYPGYEEDPITFNPTYKRGK